MTIKGILWHSTGANNPNIKRYVQPYEGDPNYDEAIAKIGYNKNHNDWNHVKNSVGVHAFIGKMADGSVGTVQALPWNYKSWGCGGSCNNGWIQFEICEDGLENKEYAQRVWDEAIELSVYLCKMYNLNPSQIAKCGKAFVPVITCHNDASKAGCASAHADINHWFPKVLGKNMDNARSEIYARLVGGSKPIVKPAGATFGIDISKWQKGIDLDKARSEGVEYAILKIGGSNNGRYKDDCFDGFYAETKQKGFPVGAYYIGGDLDEASALKSAEHCISLLSGYQFEYPIYYDVEREMLTKTNKSQLTAIVKAFCKKVESAGYWVGIYASESTFSAEFNGNDLKHFCWWVARWGKNKPAIGDMWQFGGETNEIRSNQIAGKVCDQDYCFVNYPTKIKAKKLNGFGTVKVDIAKPVIKKGSRGNNAKLLQKNLNACGWKLAEDGIFGTKSVQALTIWQQRNNLVADGIYGAKSEAKMNSILNKGF